MVIMKLRNAENAFHHILESLGSISVGTYMKINFDLKI